MVETFKTIEGFEVYSVSDHGNVRNDKTGRILKGTENRDGYLCVCLRKNKRKHHKLIHRLTAETFLLNPKIKNCVDHIDNNRQNNHLINLIFETTREKIQNAKICSKNTSGTKGVRWVEKRQKWRAQININGKQINLGSFIKKTLLISEFKEQKMHLENIYKQM